MNQHFIKITESAGVVNEKQYGENFVNHPSIIAIQQHNNNTSFEFQHTNEVQIEKLLLEINCRKSCGYDNMMPRLVKESAAVIAKPIASIVNSSNEQSVYPGAWKKGQTTPLFKKDDEFSKANYRPVTVLAVLNNVYERLLAVQMGDFYNAILSDFISSYRKLYSCETALLRLTEDWRSMRDRGELVAVMSMDLSKAFDVIQHNLLLAKLEAYGVGEKSCTLLRNYLSGRQQRVKIGDTFSSWDGVARGVPQGSVLGPMLFNVFINDLFYHVTHAKLNAYADDHQVYYSSIDPVELENCICSEVAKANEWYKVNAMKVNETKHQALILGKTEHKFSFPVKDSLDIFGMNIDNRLSFDNHVSTICKKVNNQFSVMLRFRKLITRDTLLKLYKAFVLPHFNYCSSVWHFCGSRNAGKVKALNKRILRFILQDHESSYDVLLDKINSSSLQNRRLQNFLIILYKSLFFTNYPGYLNNMFKFRLSSYNLRGNYILSLPKPKTTTYGLHSFSYLAASLWNSLPDTLRTANFLDFRREILKYKLE